MIYVIAVLYASLNATHPGSKRDLYYNGQPEVAQRCSYLPQ